MTMASALAGSLAGLALAHSWPAGEAVVQASPAPTALYLSAPCLAQPLSAATGMDVDTPLRVASITKTLTAATALRLWEDGHLPLDGSIRPLIAPELAQMLTQAGYDLDAITVRHLLNHTAGIYDHASDARYQQMWIDQPDHVWTRAEQVALSTRWSGPLHAPGTRFVYSDTGYVLLGDMIERITGQSLGKAVRQQLRLDDLNLTATWWETSEAAPKNAPSPARQFWRGHDVTQMHGSLDTHGGGGLVMSTRDLTRFFSTLLDGRVFKHPDTLREMLAPAEHEGGQRYRLGIMALDDADAQGHTAYWHSGFWGTVVYTVPQTGVSIAGVITEQSAYGEMNRQLLDLLKTFRCP